MKCRIGVMASSPNPIADVLSSLESFRFDPFEETAVELVLRDPLHLLILSLGVSQRQILDYLVFQRGANPSSKIELTPAYPN